MVQAKSEVNSALRQTILDVTDPYAEQTLKCNNKTNLTA